MIPSPSEVRSLIESARIEESIGNPYPMRALIEMVLEHYRSTSLRPDEPIRIGLKDIATKQATEVILEA